MTAPVSSAQAQTQAFGFGENWADYARHIEAEHLAKAREALTELLGDVALDGKRFLDIGCGSGLHALAALKSGAAYVTALDVDEDSVATTKSVLGQFWNNDNYDVSSASILDEEILKGSAFDIVYSWGVLHHTGNMWRAIENAASLVDDDGHFVIAIYKKTPFCRFWVLEKKLYKSLPKLLRLPFDGLYALVQICGLSLKGRNPVSYIKSYKEKRGMRWMTDIKDWLGGFPYESAAPKEIKDFIEALGFRQLKAVNDGPVPALGILGSGCAEYVFKKI